MNILVVVPQYKPCVGDFYDFPLGLAYISAVLKKEGHAVHVLNLNHYGQPLPALLKSALLTHNIQVLCTGGLCTHYHKIKQILTEARAVKSDLITILGGGLIISEPELMLQTLRPSFGVIGEGEITIAELTRALETHADAASINGLIYYDPAGNLCRTPERAPIEDLDSLPWPDYEGFEIDQYLDAQLPNDAYYLYPFDKPRMLPVIASRSCPYNCSFCFHPLGRKYRRRSLDGFFAEVEYLIDRYHINMLAVVDEVLDINKRRIREFCQRMRQYRLKWLVQLRVPSADAETIADLKDAGCHYISYGLESAHDDVLKSMNKFITVAQIENALALTRAHRVGIQGNFLFSARDETYETALHTTQWWADHVYYHIHLNTLSPYPGSDDYRYALEKGLILDRLKYIEHEFPVINLSRMTGEQFSRIYTFCVRSRFNFFIFPEVLAVRKTGRSDIRRADLYTLTVRCPHCATVSTYNNFHLPLAGYSKLACRSCNQRFDLSPEIFDHSKPLIPQLREQVAKFAFENANFYLNPNPLPPLPPLPAAQPELAASV